jgi:hypothetical protein
MKRRGSWPCWNEIHQSGEIALAIAFALGRGNTRVGAPPALPVEQIIRFFLTHGSFREGARV